MNENYVVTVDLELKTKMTFKKHTMFMKNALSSLKEEEGCLRFDVIKIDESNDFMLMKSIKTGNHF